MSEIPRPQPLGAFPLPQGMLLIDGPEHESIREQLLVGKLPARWPEALEGNRLAFEGEYDRAIEWFAGDDSGVAKFNLFVLDPSRIERSEVVAALGEQWRPLVDYVAFTLGLTSIPPTPDNTDREIAALVWTSQAAAALDNGEEEEALAALSNALDLAEESHPAYAAVVLTEVSGRVNDLELAEKALALLKGTDLKAQYSEALYQRSGLIHGLALEGRRPLQEAISGYTDALKNLNEKDHGPLFARIHMNLGIALLAQPIMGPSDNLRAGVAVQSLRTAARLLDEKNDSEEWASAQLNLANALVYAPSTHQRDNLMEAVDTYEKVIRLRTAKSDPLGRARVLSNQGNALAHLGLLGDARLRFDEAIFLFSSNGDEDSAQVVRDLVVEIEAAESSTEGAMS